MRDSPFEYVAEHLMSVAKQYFPQMTFTELKVREAISLSIVEVEETLLACQKTLCGCFDCYKLNLEIKEDDCPFALLSTILGLCLHLSVTTLSEGVLPTRRGIYLAYQRSLHPICNRLSESSSHHVDMFQWLQYFSEEADQGRRLIATVELFTGHAEFGLFFHQTCTAVSVAGICVYFGILKDISLDHTAISQLHVVPGQIERDCKPYSAVNDTPVLPFHHDPIETAMTDVQLSLIHI